MCECAWEKVTYVKKFQNQTRHKFENNTIS